MKVLFAASECAPIVKVGGLADVVGSLPKTLAKLGLEIAIALPHYEKIENYPDFLPGTQIPVFYLGTSQEYSGDPYPGGNQEHERFASFCRQVVDFLDTRQFEAEILHLHDYHTSLIPDIARQRKIKVATVLTIHDVQNEGRSDSDTLLVANLTSRYLQALGWDPHDRNFDMLLEGILRSDIVNTVSPTYAKEILDPGIAESLADVLQSRQARVYGILNGIDQDFYDPRSDGSIFQNYGPANFSAGKLNNKEKLQQKLDLKVDGKIPLLGMVTRLVERKGLDLVLKILPDLLGSKVQLVILGKGDPGYEKILKGEALKNSQTLSFVDAFDEDLAHQIYAASDFFLVPSKTEPCGLTQMIACRYGSLPIVHHTGGLADTVFEEQNGYVFEDFSSAGLWSAVTRALDDYATGEKRQKMIQKAMAWDFSWDQSAKRYVKLYQKALQYSFGIVRGGGGEIRQDYSGQWGILSEARSGRPIDNAELIINKEEKKKESLSIVNSQLSIESCPFEFGNEAVSAPEVFRLGPGKPETPGWEVRVIANKYPLVPVHEVIIYSPYHDKDLPDLPLLWVEKAIWTYLSRYRQHEQRGYVHIFCNHGGESGASLKHPHSQLVVLDELPKDTQNALSTAEEYYQGHHRCPYCQVLDRELLSGLVSPKSREGGPHLIYKNSSMALLTPYASDWPYELSILPLQHRASFGNINEEELKDLAQILQLSLKLLKKKYPADLSYNFWIHSLPDLFGFAKSGLYYHWHLDLVPRVKKLGGIELGIGVMVDDVASPEKATIEFRGLISEL